MVKLDKAIALLRNINESVPKPARLPTFQEVAIVEQSHNLLFHADFKRYLLEVSDVNFGILEPVTITDPKSHTYFSDVLSSARAHDVPKELVPLCEDNAGFYCMTQSGEVLFWNHDGPSNERWDSIATWIEQVWVGESEA